MSAREILEKEGLEGTYWGIKIIAAEEFEGFSEDDLKEANSWITCSCGKASPLIPRYYRPGEYLNGRPTDERMADLGMRFTDNVEADEIQGSAVTLCAIERLACEIIAELGK